MHRYPILDTWGAPLLAAGFLVWFVAEKRRPLRVRIQHWLRRLWVNLAVAAPSFVVLRLLLVPAVVGVAVACEHHHFGLARWLPLPSWLAGIVALLALDYTMFLWHWANHRSGFLWRFHAVHHSDLDLDVTTAFRFHFGEILLSVAVRSAQVALAGASPAVALAYEVLLESSTQFHHSNLALPVRLERVLSWFIMTPRAHGIHHSVVPRETNSNYSNLLMLWDRLHGTVKLDIPQASIVVGVPQLQNPQELTASRLLTMPFRTQRGGPPSSVTAPSAGHGPSAPLAP